jgi:Carboxypeptidase regulatory-like domain
MFKRTLMVFGLALVVVLAPTGSAMAFQGTVSYAMCAGNCHTHPGYTDSASWHDSHRYAPLNIWCDDCHPNGHTQPTPSAPETLYWVGVACGPCHASGDILLAHTAAGVTSCSGCHPASVRKGTLSGTVGDSNGPLAGVSVSVSGTSPVLTLADGSYSVPGISVGLCTATFAKAGYVTKTVGAIIIQNGATTTRNATLVAVPPSDITPPTTSSDARPSYVGSAAIHLTATDGPGGSGVARTYFRLDDGARTQGTDVAVAAVGSHSLEFWSVDAAGNEETPHKSAVFTITAPGPVSTSITIRTSASTAYIGGTPILSGAVSPSSMIGVNIVVYVMKPGKTYWTYSSNRTVYSLNGSPAWQYKYYFKPGMARGSYRFKAGAPAPGFASSVGFAASTSPAIGMSVR